MKYAIARTTGHRYETDITRYDTYEEAEAEARRLAYAKGADYYIFMATAIAKAPLAVNDVQVTPVV